MGINKDTAFSWILFCTQTKQLDLALKTGIGQPRISMIKNGWISPTQKERDLIAEALGMKSDEIYYPLRNEGKSE